MKCDRCRELLSWYLESDLRPEDMEEVERHLSTCQECSDELRLLEETLALARELLEFEPPAETCLQLLKKIREIAEPQESIYVWEEVRIGEEQVETLTLEGEQRSPSRRKARATSQYWNEVVRRFNGTWWSFTEKWA